MSNMTNPYELTATEAIELIKNRKYVNSFRISRKCI